VIQDRSLPSLPESYPNSPETHPQPSDQELPSPPFLPDYSYSNPNWARVFIGTTRRQRIEHIRQIHDPADNGDVLALQALRVAVTVPFLMVGQGDRVRQPDDLGIRSFENLGTIERVVFTSANSSSVSLPGLRRILSEMPIFPTSCMGEA